MLMISHRGNLTGPEPDRENTPSYITFASREGYIVEVDIWCVNGKFFFGHDEPQYEITRAHLYKPDLIFHAKNYSALRELLELNMHVFWHQEDRYTISNKGLVIAYPGEEAEGCVSMTPEINDYSLRNLQDRGCVGICSDVIGTYRKEYDEVYS